MSDKVFYKYRSINQNTISLLINNILHFSFPSEFNDPFDCASFYKFTGDFEEEYESVLSIFDINNDKKVNGIQKKRKKIILHNQDKLYQDEDNYLIYSLSEINDSILMWSHYAEDHKGICIGFKCKYYDINNIKKHFLLVTKDNIKSEVYPAFLSSELIPVFKVNYIDDSLTYFNQEKLIDVLTNKYIDWSYEKEYRLIILKKHLKKINRKKEEFQNIIFSENILDSIYFGINTSKNDKDLIKNIIKIKNLKIPIYEAKYKKYQFSVDFCRIK